MPVVGMIVGAAHVDCCRTQVQLDQGWNFSKALSWTRLISIQKISLRHTDLTRGKVGMWYQVRPAQRCVILVQRCFSCCVTTGSFSFTSRACCCSLQTSSCPRLPGLAPAVGAVCCISWNRCRLWELQRGCSPAESCRAFPFKVCCCCSAGSGNPLPLPARTVCCFCSDAASWNCINSCIYFPACSGLL